MIKILVVGWYGTETIGDRAILAGLLKIFEEAFGSFEITLASLFPFFSERTIKEDDSFYRDILREIPDVKIVDSRNFAVMRRNIVKSDLIIMGGGPLMDLETLYLIEYVFKKAQKSAKRTALLGCGVGPLFKEKYHKAVLNIFQNTDLAVLRDVKSLENIEALFLKSKNSFDSGKIFTSLDPAVFTACEYLKIMSPEPSPDYIALNLRNFPEEYSTENCASEINYKLKTFVSDVSERFSSKTVKLIPMHYFHVGGDDRQFLNRIKMELNKENIQVQNQNLSLKETMKVFQNARFCVGMRFHAVVLQTILNGKNFILDYTEPGKGKISGFLNDIDAVPFYNKRYWSLQNKVAKQLQVNSVQDGFVSDQQKIESRKALYIDKLKDLMK
jgi:polysaccharide pyruvyl transferase WcaK-like protein